MRISRCMIVRDEADTLARCLEPLQGVVDELCIVDTGSTDGTLALARELGARATSFEWCDDFSAARNACLKIASGDWVLVLDADEFLIPDGARAALLEFAQAHPAAIGRVRIKNIEVAGGSAGSSTHISRFFPRCDELRFAGRVHEQLVHSAAEPERLDTGVAALHHGYTHEALVSRRKLERNRALVTRALEEAPLDAYLWYQLGRTEFVAEDHTAAWQALFRSIELLDGERTPFVALLFETAAYSLRALGRSEEALALLVPLVPRFKERPDMLFAQALLWMDTGRLAEAEAGFRACLLLEGADPEGGESALCASTWAPAFNLGVMHEMLQKTAAALDWYRRALAHRPDHQPSLSGIARCS